MAAAAFLNKLKLGTLVIVLSVLPGVSQATVLEVTSYASGPSKLSAESEAKTSVMFACSFGGGSPVGQPYIIWAVQASPLLWEASAGVMCNYP